VTANREIQPEGQKPLPAGACTVARLFRENGYTTACVGKWGLGMFGNVRSSPTTRPPA
jgi:arylsulfatase A-like enzyme